jgi:hypothetical protein
VTSDVRQLTDSERDWLATRDYLRNHRPELDPLAAAEFPDAVKVGDTPLLAAPEWIPGTPLPLEAVNLELHADAPRSGVTGTDAQPGLPQRASGEPYTSYSQAVGELGAPAVFENRPTYRLLEADLTGGHGRLVFGQGSYFDGLDTGEAAGHEAVLAHLGRVVVPGGIRERIGDPCDLRRRPVNLAITTLTIRRAADGDTFLLHWRDPGKVGHAGGLHQVVPVGIFQPTGEADWNLRNDFSLWRNMIREFSEELLGQSEDYNSEQAPIDYHAWPFAARLEQARASGQLRAYCLGLGVDPLTFAADLLTAVIIDAPVFDDLFPAVVTDNAEGRILTAQPFNLGAVEQILAERPIQAAGAALLRLAITRDLA